MAEKQIKVKVPITTNGSNPLLIAGVQQFKYVILAEGARKGLEKINLTLPNHLKVEITDYVDTFIAAIVPESPNGVLDPIKETQQVVKPKTGRPKKILETA